jgi:hypothetical protein
MPGGSLEVRQNSLNGQLITLEAILRYRELKDEVNGVAFKRRIAEILAVSIKRLWGSKPPMTLRTGVRTSSC